MVRIIGQEISIFNTFIAELRNVEWQIDSMRFRRNLERIGEVMAYEISKTMKFTEAEVTTPLGVSNEFILAAQPVLATILRAGLPFHQGFLNYFDRAENAFISAYRKHHKDGSFDIQLEYLASPDLNGKTLILCDPMLATGASMIMTYQHMLKKGKPEHTHLVSIIGSREGLEYIERSISPDQVTVWLGAVDEELTAQAYIVPGLGDAGDLAYGEKS
jgi:uracil phosphoribosyltransferase